MEVISGRRTLANLPRGSLFLCRRTRTVAMRYSCSCGVPTVVKDLANNWVAVKELNLSYYIGETLLFTIYIYPLW